MTPVYQSRVDGDDGDQILVRHCFGFGAGWPFLPYSKRARK